MLNELSIELTNFCNGSGFVVRVFFNDAVSTRSYLSFKTLKNY